MDDFDFKGAEMSLVLNDLEGVNKWLGGNATTIRGLKSLLKTHHKRDRLRIVDLGCGDGQQLRLCSKWLEKRGFRHELIGFDANEYIVEEAIKRSEGYDHIRFIAMDVFSEEFQQWEYDIALCTLFLHHFDEEESTALLKKMVRKAKVGVVINDLERSRTAFWLFRLYSRFLLRSRTAEFDGLVSIASAFKKKELQRMSAHIAGEHSILWQWAFRYQWIIRII